MICSCLPVVKAPPSGTASSQSILSKTLVPGALVFCATLLAYLPALPGEFIWNDSDYVTAPALRSLNGLARIWIEVGATQQYYPLLHSAFWVQHRILGDHPLGYHIITLLLHAGSAVLFALVLRRLMGSDRAQPGAARAGNDQSATGRGGDGQRSSWTQPCAGVEWLAALLFALHPVHVESVAWITEQKNTLSLAFYLAAALVYLQFDETRRPRTYLAALALFVFSLWCKTVTATLPAALLVAFWWKRGRLDWRRDVWPLLPWLTVGAAAGLFSSWVEHTYIGAQGVEFDLPLIGRALVAGRAIWFYAGQLVWPFGLNFVYPRWPPSARFHSRAGAAGRGRDPHQCSGSHPARSDDLGIPGARGLVSSWRGRWLRWGDCKFGPRWCASGGRDHPSSRKVVGRFRLAVYGARKLVRVAEFPLVDDIEKVIAITDGMDRLSFRAWVRLARTPILTTRPRFQVRPPRARCCHRDSAGTCRETPARSY